MRSGDRGKSAYVSKAVGAVGAVAPSRVRARR